MKKHLTLSGLSIFIITMAMAQPPKTPPKEFPAAIPKHETGKPVANIKTFPPLAEYIYTDGWKGTVSWATAEAGHSSTIPDIRFTLNAEAIWQSPFPEIVTAQPGSVRINGNDVSFSFNYSPYKYSFTGVYNKYTGKIAGTFTQDRMKYLSAPVNYTPGNISGTFTITKK